MTTASATRRTYKRICKIDDCDTTARKAGMCKFHLNRTAAPADMQCKIDGCERYQFTRGLCNPCEVKEWRRENPDANRISHARYASNQDGVAHHREALMIAQGGICAIGGDPIAEGDVHIDHIIPRAFFYRRSEEVITSIHNAQATCSTCNIRKRDKYPPQATITRIMEATGRLS